jgi:hypothetical protein
MKRNKKSFPVVTALLLVPLCLNAGMAFNDVPANHWAYDAVRELSERGIIEGFEGRAQSHFKGEKPMTRYEFAQALLKTIQKLEAEMGVSKATGVIDEVNVKALLDKSTLGSKDIDLLKKLILEFQKELADMNLRVTNLEAKQREMEISTPKTPLYLSLGAAVISVLALIISIAH